MRVLPVEEDLGIFRRPAHGGVFPWYIEWPWLRDEAADADQK